MPMIVKSNKNTKNGKSSKQTKVHIRKKREPMMVKNSKQIKEQIKKKVLEDKNKNPKKILDVKKESVPKKEFHHEYKRLMKIFIDNSKLVNADTFTDVKLSKDEVLHHLSTNLEKSYSYSFIYIRQLALTLRKAINSTQKASVYSIYNWQYINCLELWSDFLVENASSHELIASLIHPLVEIIVGVIRFRPSARYLPVRFHCLKLLNQMTNSLKTITPMLANVIEVFNCVDFNQSCKNESKSTMNPLVMLHFSTSQLSTFEYLEITIDNIFQMIIENICVFANEPAFPEYTSFLTITLKSFVKRCKVAAFKNAIRSLLFKIKEHSEYVKRERMLHPFVTVIVKDVAFEKFVENYRIARTNELEKLMDATKHQKYQQPHEDIKDMEKPMDHEDEASELDDDEFEGEDVEYDSAVDIDDE